MVQRDQIFVGDESGGPATGPTSAGTVTQAIASTKARRSIVRTSTDAGGTKPTRTGVDSRRERSPSGRVIIRDAAGLRALGQSSGHTLTVGAKPE